MALHQYWNDIDLRLESLIKEGFVKLPSLEIFDLNSIAEKINEDMKGKTFSELCPSHNIFLKELDLENHLAPRLHKIACDLFGYKGKLSNQYHIARRVEPGNSKELYRAHFDSHLFTLVLPIKIPVAQNGGSVGDLIFFPNARRRPKSELINFVGKLYHKKYASKEGLDNFASGHDRLMDDFCDYCPLLFLGNTTLHTNKQVSPDCSTYRLTLLAHFFDPSPKFGVGGVLRLLRAR